MIDLDRLCRAEWGHLLSSLIRAFGDFDVAEEALQEAFSAAVVDWAEAPPNNPLAWLYGTARHRAIDRIRHRARSQVLLAELAPFDERHLQSTVPDDAVPDERLRLIFTCCHPALAEEARVALTLRTLGGLTTDEIAHAFLVPTSTMAQRLVRAKVQDPRSRHSVLDSRSRRAARAPVGGDGGAVSDFQRRLRGGAGQASSCAGRCRARPSNSTRLLRALLQARLGSVPAEVDSLLALMLLHDARRETRVAADGELVLLEEQDRSRAGIAPKSRKAARSCMRRCARARPAPTRWKPRSPPCTPNRPALRRLIGRKLPGLYARLLELHTRRRSWR